ncbi:hypothetical protein BJY04DRAFT_41431 [Aspergillus karnatakaensis]|uniref:uncharacterized protein n=1 Tax=Aspergillus karnatakaensis TaxID=1810916 RepID=UPI003CCDE601
MTPTLLCLPPEILFAVGDYLAADHLPSLHAFALASKYCCSLVNRHRFKNIHLHSYSNGVLHLLLDYWEQILQRNKAHSYVQRLSIAGIRPPWKTPARPDGNSELPIYQQPSFQGEDDWTDLSTRYIGSFYDRDQQPISFEPTAWGALPDFLRKLPALRDLFWVAAGDFPPSLLVTLHSALPKCSLHLRFIREGYRYSSTPLPEGYDAYQRTLATSPSLSSIRVAMSDTDSGKFFTERAVLCLAAGLAPSLREVCIDYRYQNRSNHDSSHPSEDLLSELPSPSNSLRSLALCNPLLENIQKWNDHVPFTNLTTFQLRSKLSSHLLSKIGTYNLTSLKSLVLHFEQGIIPRRRLGVVEGLDKHPDTLLCRLPPLESLLITGYLAEQPISLPLEHHGPTLKKLGLLFSRPTEERPRLGPHVAPYLIKDIRAHCPRLRHLAIQIPRTQGNKAEVAIYRSLNIPSLARLDLDLDCTPTTKDTKSHLINLAVDEPLVRSIFSLVSGDCSPDSLLQSLKVKVVKNYTQPNELTAFEHVFMELTWEVFRSVDGVFVHRSVDKKRDSYRDMVKDPDNWMRSVPAIEVFRSLWPSKGRDWSEDWFSFPLEID